MHPIFISSRSFTAILALWAVVCALCTAMMTAMAAGSLSLPWTALAIDSVVLGLPWYTVLLFVCLSNFYLCLRLPLRTAPPVHLVLIQWVSVVVAVGVWLLFGMVWANSLVAMGFSAAVTVFNATILINILVAVLVYLLWVLLHYVYLTALSGEHLNSDELAKKLLISEVELQAIKAALHPHFLYNSLNMLANLSLVAPEKIHPLCVQMSEFLRYSVSYGNKGYVSLQDEVNHITNYLDIERERFGKRLHVNMVMSGTMDDVKVFPLLLFPLVENCIKHGVDASIEPCAITVAIEQKDTIVDIRITNTLDPEGVPPPSTKHGLASVQKRLRAHFGEQASLVTHKTQTLFEVVLNIPITVQEQKQVSHAY